ncbi:MAG: SDR family NAD(P)-dependent oxidoreductase [Actinomycetota bacterium]|nr:SDR family NAD(P)-dependent oxidoreductase [Actinomycetota bacterium]
MTTRRALVTGGNRGLGAAIARALDEAGCEVLLVASRNESLAGSTYEGFAADLSSLEETQDLAARLAAESIDILVNNAGINRIAPFAEIDPADFQAVQDINLRAPMLLCQSVLGHMRARGWGRIVNVASIWAEVSRAQRASYSASKSGLVGMTRALAAEVACDGILVNCVSPGVIETDLTLQVLGAEGVARIQQEIPIGRLGQPAEVAALVAFLAGEQNTYISGQAILIDGGFTSV